MCRREGRRRLAPACQDSPVTDQEARYDSIAEAYAEVWSPVHRPATLALLDEIAHDVDAGARRLVDVGCGTGALAAAAVRRWPAAELDGVDVSAGMLQVAGRFVDGLPAPEGERIRLHQAPADRLPFEDGSFDVALTAFVLQLVPSRHRALREMRRVLRSRRPGRRRYLDARRGAARGGPRLRRRAGRRRAGAARQWGRRRRHRVARGGGRDPAARGLLGRRGPRRHR